jgi:hypothetical protein
MHTLARSLTPTAFLFLSATAARFVNNEKSPDCYDDILTHTFRLGALRIHKRSGA